MSINWVMLAEGSGYTPLPGETTLYQSPPRTTLSLQSPVRNPPADTYSQHCKSGVIYLTNRRIIYLPLSPTPAFTSFAVPILNITDSRVTAPWFGANKWEASLTPVPAGGIPHTTTALDLVMEFKEGGAFDFATTFERLRERLRHAVDVAQVQMHNQTGAGALDGVNLSGVHLEDLPAYEDTRYVRVPEDMPMPTQGARGGSVGTQGTGSSAGRSSPMGSPRGRAAPPLEPPPGYEEVQRGVVAEEVERQMRGGGWAGSDHEAKQAK